MAKINKGSELYCRGYNYGMKMACDDIKNGIEKKQPLEGKTAWLAGLNAGYAASYKEYENSNAKVLKKSR